MKWAVLAGTRSLVDSFVFLCLSAFSPPHPTPPVHKAKNTSDSSPDESSALQTLESSGFQRREVSGWKGVGGLGGRSCLGATGLLKHAPAFLLPSSGKKDGHSAPQSFPNP